MLSFFRKILSILLLMTILIAKAQENWKIYRLPVFNDCKQIQTTKANKLYINAGQLLTYRDSVWQLFPQQPPCETALMSVVDSTCIYVADRTPYQNSNLYLWNGVYWKRIEHPLVNSISSMEFIDKNNAVITGYGEIVLLENGKWKHLTPPYNGDISQGIFYRNQIIVLVRKKGIFFYHNNNWKKIPASEKVKLLVKSSGKIYAVGNNFLSELTDNQLLRISTDKLWKEINSLCSKNGEIIAVGNKALILRLNQSVVSKKYLPEKIKLNQIIYHRQHLWIAGDEGSLYRSTANPVQNVTYWKGFKQKTFKQTAKIIDDEYGVITADFNNDGWTDIFTCGLFEEDHLYINHENMQFTDQAKKFGLENNNNTTGDKLNLGACAGDFDNDGDIDLYISILNGKNILYKNISGKYFIDYSKISGATGQAGDRTNASITADVDNDGDLDLFITNEFSTNRLYLNNGAGIFNEVTESCGLQTKGGGNSAVFSDIDNDGDMDLYVSNWSSPNILYQNLFKETGNLVFKDITASSGTGGLAYEKSNAVCLTDLNNDEYVDIFVTNRKTSNRLYINNKDNTFSDQTGLLIPEDKDESYGAVITDFDGDGFKDIYVSNVGENKFYKNEKGRWIEQSLRYGAGIKGYSTGSALSDFDQDGDPDIYIANYLGAGSTLLVNNAPSGKFVQIKTRLFRNNRNGIGSRILLYDRKNDSLLYSTEITAGSGYVSMNDAVVQIPYFPNTYLKIILPDGEVKIIDKLSPEVPVNISDATGFQKFIFNTQAFLIRQLYDPHRLYEWIKWLFVWLFVGFSTRKHRNKYHWHRSFSLAVFLSLILLYYWQYSQFEYAGFFLSTLLPLSSIVIINLLIHYYFEQRHIQAEALKKQKEIKYKLSRNLHDDLAATISSTGLYLTMMKLHLQKNSGKLHQLINKAEELLQDAAGTITDLIWSIRPQPESLESLLLRIQKNFKDLFEQQNSRLQINRQNEQINKIKISDTNKQNTYLILKEALNNILKYAAASEVTINLKLTGNTIEITVADNGKGFDVKTAEKQGNGLRNMQTRALELPDGYFQIESSPTGSKIIFGFSLKK